MTDVTVSVGGFTAGKIPHYDERGVAWTLQNITGWHDSPPTRSAPIVRPGVDGTLDADPQDDARLIVVDGHIDAPHEGALLDAMRRVSSLLSNPKRGPLIVSEQMTGISAMAEVRREGVARTVRDSECGAAFQWTLYAPDPTRYATTSNLVYVSPYKEPGGHPFPVAFNIPFGQLGGGGFVTVRNNGERAVWPIIRIPGPATNPLVRVAGGRTLRYLGTLALGETLTINSRNRTVTVNGASARTRLSPGSSYFPLPPGETVLFYDTDSDADTGIASIQWTETI